jgi:hypothetical protein
MHELASVLLHKIIGSPLPSPTEEKLISQLLVNLEQTSNISTDQKIFVRVSELINRDSGWKNIHWWEIEQRGTVFEIRGGDDLYQFSTGQDSFTIGHWEAQPADVTLHNSTNTMWYMKPDMEEFCAAVNSMDLSLPGYQLEVTE